MTQARAHLVATEDTPYYHCVSRCVRRAFLCGSGENGRSYEHRRQWIEDRIRLLSSIFTVGICSYAVMSNHYHIVVKLSSSDELTQDEVIQRWLTLHRGPLLIQQYVQGKPLEKIEFDTITKITDVWRRRLSSLSWFMKCLNEPIARMANEEDKCTGHFWESRFKSQALLTEEALLSCMAYVDLNPVRAKMAATPETSNHTSIKERIKPTFDLREAIKKQGLNSFELPIKALLHFDDAITDQKNSRIPFSLYDYLQLVDWTGRAIRDNKRGHIPSHLPPILQRLNIPTDEWLDNSQQFERIVHRRFKKAA